jgi:L-lactate dehydrogenase (cytochrome)
MPVTTTIEDLRVLAERRVPRMFYDYVDCGSWTESTYRANSEDFQKIMRLRVERCSILTATRWRSLIF